MRRGRDRTLRRQALGGRGGRAGPGRAGRPPMQRIARDRRLAKDVACNTTDDASLQARVNHRRKQTHDAPRTTTLRPAGFPTTRLRRLRYHPAVRHLVRETRLSPANLILPLFVRPGRERPAGDLGHAGPLPALARPAGRRDPPGGRAGARRRDPVRHSGREGRRRQRRHERRGHHRRRPSARRSRPRPTCS